MEGKGRGGKAFPISHLAGCAWPPLPAVAGTDLPRPRAGGGVGTAGLPFAGWLFGRLQEQRTQKGQMRETSPPPRGLDMCVCEVVVMMGEREKRDVLGTSVAVAVVVADAEQFSWPWRPWPCLPRL